MPKICKILNVLSIAFCYLAFLSLIGCVAVPILKFNTTLADWITFLGIGFGSFVWCFLNKLMIDIINFICLKLNSISIDIKDLYSAKTNK